MFNRGICYLILLSALTAGCSSRYHMRINSTPAAAQVYCGGEYIGETPDVHIYSKKINPDVQTQYQSDCILKWPSGASKEVGTIRVHKHGGTRIHVERPADAPNVELDYQVAHQREIERLQKGMLDQQKRMADVQELMLFQSQMPKSTNTRCYTDSFGTTNCSSSTY